MNGCDFHLVAPSTSDSGPPTEEYVTAVGGLAAFPTAAVYSVPVRSGTPVEAVGYGSRLSPVIAGYQATAPSIDLSRIVGSAAYPIIGCQQVVQHLSVGNHLRLAMGVWEEAWRTIESLDVPSRDEAGPRAWEAFKEVASWLTATDAELAAAIGIGRTTVYTWQRENREPRRGTARQIHELHAAIRALRRRLGGGGLEAWLGAGSPNRRQLILRGGLRELEGQIDGVLFSAASQPDFSAVPVDRGGVDPVDDDAPPLRPAKRRARRAKLR